MDASRISERLRAIIAPPGGGPPPSAPHTGALGRPEGSLESALGGRWQPCRSGRCFVVERLVDGAATHGRRPVRDIAARLSGAAGAAALVGRRPSARPPFLFFDLETTGLNGGAGTLAFLVGIGRFDELGRFVTRQYVMARHADEPALLRAVSEELRTAGALVSFNGRAFDAPMLESRCLFHRFDWEGGAHPHLDMLHPARRFWRARSRWATPGEAAGECSLTALERRVFGIHRAGDIPGAEVPARYFEFVRTGDARPLVAVLDHNRQDLLSLAALTARLFHLVQAGEGSAANAREALELGHVYTRAGLDQRARDAFEKALAMCDLPTASEPAVEALRSLALSWRRARRHAEAARCWQRLLDVPGCPAHVAREANEALAIHHEHRARDLCTAKTFALRTLEAAVVRQGWSEAARHRLARIERKLGLLEGLE
jgi:uncharacterized protein YprB with RNaseH-like and TPR domain